MEKRCFGPTMKARMSDHILPYRSFWGLLFLILCSFSLYAAAEKEGPLYEERVPGKEEMKELQKEGPYDYRTEEEKDVGERSLWTQIRTFLDDYFYSPVEYAIYRSPYFQYALWALGVGAILFYFWKNGAMAIFREDAAKKSKDPLPFTPLDMEEESPLRKARNAEKEGALIDALRWRYIHIVQALGSKGLIRKSPHRTDREYLRDLQGSGFEEAFGKLSRFFQLVRYGDRPLREGDYEEWKERFKELERRVKHYEAG